jgi:cytochrome c biogenesis protein CcmG, thiol:disulfide interchange protein DsbE
MSRSSTKWLIGTVILVTLLVVLGLVLKAPNSSSSTPEPKVGHPAPPFTLQTVDGKHVSLNAFRGKVVLLNFFATWCIPCRHELPHIKQAFEAHHGDFAVLLIDKAEPAADVRSFASDLGLPFKPLLDPTLSAWSAYQVQNIQPVSFWIDRGGIIRSRDYEMDASVIARELRRFHLA